MKDPCYFCKGELRPANVTVDFRWGGGDLVVIEDVPAYVCSQCGERYFDAEVSEKVEKLALAQTKPTRTITIPVLKFPVPA